MKSRCGFFYMNAQTKTQTKNKQTNTTFYVDDFWEIFKQHINNHTTGHGEKKKINETTISETQTHIKIKIYIRSVGVYT
jgi:hypothetical protein